MISNLKKSCAIKAKEHEADQQARSEEMSAISQAIKILNDDDALEMFKKTLPSPGDSFLQTGLRRNSRYGRIRMHPSPLSSEETVGAANGALSLLSVKMETSHR